jgi:hypothetical protein
MWGGENGDYSAVPRPGRPRHRNDRQQGLDDIGRDDSASSIE